MAIAIQSVTGCYNKVVDIPSCDLLPTLLHNLELMIIITIYVHWSCGFIVTGMNSLYQRGTELEPCEA